MATFKNKKISNVLQEMEELQLKIKRCNNPAMLIVYCIQMSCLKANYIKILSNG